MSCRCGVLSKAFLFLFLHALRVSLSDTSSFQIGRMFQLVVNLKGEDNAGDSGLYLWLQYHAQQQVRITVHGKRSYNHGTQTVDQYGIIKH